MPDDLEQAKALLAKEDLTVAAVRGTAVLASTERGVKPLLAWLDAGASLEGFSVADKVVGNGAAWLYVALGAKTVWAPVMSDPAKATLASHGIEAFPEVLVPGIKNRAGDGFCPMESAVASCQTAETALANIRSTAARLAGSAAN